MSFNVPDKVKIAMLEERTKAVKIEGQRHGLSRKSAEAIGNADVVAQSEESIAIIASAIAVHEQELSDLA